MSNITSASTTTAAPAAVPVSIPLMVRFWCFTGFLIPSLICSLFVLYHMLTTRALRTALNNHVIILLLCIGLISQLTSYPWRMHYLLTGQVVTKTLVFCVTYYFTDFSPTCIQTILFGWATIERHILIFHDRLLATNKKRWLFHYLPIILLLVYSIVYYSIICLFPPCGQLYPLGGLSCSFPCYFYNIQWNWYELVFNQAFPIFVNLVASLSLIVRVIRHRSRVQGRVEWRKHRKLTIQVLGISFLYLVLVLPYAVSNLLIQYGLKSITLSNYGTVVRFNAQFCLLCIPFACALASPEIRKKITGLFGSHRRMMAVGPATINNTVMRSNKQ